ncbi:MAG: molybdate ABC transporter substrate-binding protein [Planctomycetota bacterium]|nr:molybdate ABC transporter substrate-binding protein [Planctomycetota bacterium]
MIRRSHRSPGRPGLAILAAAAMLAGCGGADDADQGPLRCYVGGTMRPAIEELAKAYQAETGRRIELDFGDSGTSLIKAETTGRGDLYVAHDPFHGAAVKKGLSAGGWCVATLKPVIAVPKGNPKGIRGLKDLAQPGLRLVLTDAMYSTAGHVVARMLKKAGLADAVEKNVVTRVRMGGEAANAVILGHADAAIAWNAVVFLRREKLDAVAVEPEYALQPGVDAVTSATFGPIDMGVIRVTIDVLKSSRRPGEARAFAEFVASDKAQEVWQRLGYSPPPPGPRQLDAAAAGQTPAAGDTLLAYVGAGLKPAMDDLVKAFGEKTGITVLCDYGGSGMIISRLRLARRGDLFMPGDLWYVELAEKEDLIASKASVCYFVPVILVQKGNPKNIAGLADLVRPGVRLGLGNPKACQVGRASEAIFARSGIPAEAVAGNLVFSSVTVNELGIQVTMGQLDAAIVWDAVAAFYAGKADVVPIPPAQNEISNVAVGVLKCSQQPAAAQQFVDFLVGPDGQAIFRKHQYRTEPPK